MLISKEKILHAMNLTPGDIARALEANGYEAGIADTATFQGLTSQGSFQYRVAYKDHTGQDEHSVVYVRYTAFYTLVANH